MWAEDSIEVLAVNQAEPIAVDATCDTLHTCQPSPAEFAAICADTDELRSVEVWQQLVESDQQLKR